MRVERSFASQQDGGPVGPQAARPNQTSTVVAETSQRLQGMLVQKLKQRQTIDASAIVADKLTSIQESANKAYLEAQQKVGSSLDVADPNSRAENLDVIVNDPLSASHDKKPFSEYVLGVYDDKVKEELAGIKNPLARVELQRRLTNFRGKLGNQALMFEAQSTVQLRKDMLGNAAERMGRMIVQNPEEFNDSITQLSAFVDNAKLGINSPAVKKSVANELAISAAEGWINIDPMKAKEMLATNDAPFMQYLTPSQIINFKNKAEGRISQQLAEKKQQVTSLEASHEKSIAETGRGIPGFENEVRLAYVDRPEVAEQKLNEYKVWRGAFEHRSAIDQMPVDQIGEYINGVKPKSGDPEYNIKDRVSSYLEQAANEQLQLVSKDPAKLAETLFSDEFEKITPEDVVGKAKFRLAVQDRKGVPSYAQRILTNSERDGFIYAIEAAPPDQVLSVIRDTVSQFDKADPSESSLSPRVFKELIGKKGLDPMYGVLIQNVQDGAPVAFDLVRAIKLKKEIRTEYTDEKKSKAMYEAVDSSMHKFADSFLHGSAENLAPYNKLRQVVFNLAGMYQVERGMSTSQAARKAVDELVNEKIAKIDGALIIPKTVERGDSKVALEPKMVQRGLGNLRKGLLDGTVKYGQDITFQGAAKWVPGDLRQDIIRGALRNGYWKTTPDFTGANYMVPFVDGDLPLLDEQGQNFYVPFDEASKAKEFPEQEFRKWYAQVSAENNLNPNPDEPKHFYDYRAAYSAGVRKPDATGHWPSAYKKEGHPRMIVDGVNTKTGKRV